MTWAQKTTDRRRPRILLMHGAADTDLPGDFTLQAGRSRRDHPGRAGRDPPHDLHTWSERCPPDLLAAYSAEADAPPVIVLIHSIS